MRFFLVPLFCLAIGSEPVSAGQALTDQDALQAARERINLSGRQRMLSQRLSAAACLVMRRIDEENRRSLATDSLRDFSRVLHALEFGDQGLGLSPETNKEILRSLTEVHFVWDDLAAAVRQVLHDDVHSFVVQQLIDGSVPLLVKSNDAVQEIVAAYGEGVIDPDTAGTIDVAGRQRMLSQKMMKEACYVATRLDEAKHRVSLRNTMAQFKTSLLQLMYGNERNGIMVPPEHIFEQLKVVEELWLAYSAGLQLVVQNLRSDDEHLEQLAFQSDALLREMHKAVLLYVQN